MKTDARVRYTLMRIKEAFFTLLEQKPVARITTKELCDLAEINRATFYKHYTDIFGLLDAIEEEALEHLRSGIRQTERQFPTEFLEAALRSIQDPQKKYLALCGKNGDPNFLARISEVMYQEFFPVLSGALPQCGEAVQQAAYLFLAGGSSSLLSAWLRDTARPSPEEFSASLLRMCTAFISALTEMEASPM